MLPQMSDAESMKQRGLLASGKYLWFVLTLSPFPTSGVIVGAGPNKKRTQYAVSHKQDQPDLETNSRHLLDRRHHWGNQRRDGRR